VESERATVPGNCPASDETLLLKGVLVDFGRWCRFGDLHVPLSALLDGWPRLLALSDGMERGSGGGAGQAPREVALGMLS